MLPCSPACAPLPGENLVLMGQVDPSKEVPPGLTAVSEAEIRQAARAEKEAARLKGSMLARFDFLVRVAVCGSAGWNRAGGLVDCTGWPAYGGR
jgi:hypothetical protein